jgi:RNA polymerase sigma-70 factor (ECF subfamily)
VSSSTVVAGFRSAALPSEKGGKPPEPEAAALVRSNDEALMELVQAGDRDALGALFDRYSRLVFGVAARILRDASEAQELVQDVFIYLYKKGRNFDPAKGSLKSWLVQIVYCRAFDRRDYLKAHRFYDSCDIEELADSLESRDCLEGHAQRTELRGMVNAAFSGLKERQRRTLEMFFFEGYSLREISLQLGEPFGNVRHHYYRGLAKLRETFKRDHPTITNGAE